MIEVGKKYRVIGYPILGSRKYNGDIVTIKTTLPHIMCEENDLLLMPAWLEEVIEQEPQSNVDAPEDFQAQFAVYNRLQGKAQDITGEQIADEVLKRTDELSKKVRVFETGSRRDADDHKPRIIDLMPYTRLRFGYHLLIGSKNYGINNFQLGQDDTSSLSSIHRHLAAYEYEKLNNLPHSEDHLCSIIFGLQLILQNEDMAGVPADFFYKQWLAKQEKLRDEKN